MALVKSVSKFAFGVLAVIAGAALLLRLMPELRAKVAPWLTF